MPAITGVASQKVGQLVAPQLARVLAVVEHDVLQLLSVKRSPGRPSMPDNRCWAITSPERVRSARSVRSSPMMRSKPSSG